MTGTVTSSGRGGTAAAMTQNEQTAEEHSTLEQQPPGRLDHPAWCVVWTVQPASTLKHSEDADVNHVHRIVNCIEQLTNKIRLSGNLVSFLTVESL